MADDDHDEEPLYLGVGAVHELAGKPKRTKKPKAFGFVHFPDPPAEKTSRPAAKRPTRKVRRASKAR
jgi:hypothetical protein